MESEIGFFGGEVFNLIDEQKTKLNLFTGSRINLPAGRQGAG